MFHFCSARCHDKFSADPATYLRPKQANTQAAAPAGTIYTCPMHPQIRQTGPGSCPICGMALEPLVATADEEPNHELIDMSRRLWIGAVLAGQKCNEVAHTLTLLFGASREFNSHATAGMHNPHQTFGVNFHPRCSQAEVNR